jgi:YgiT-type zinc finger domain-containing protein
MTYDPCEYCGSKVKERIVRVDHRWKETLTIVEKVPVGVCVECGERYYPAAVLRQLDQIAKGKVSPIGQITVPIADYSRAAAP